MLIIRITEKVLEELSLKKIDILTIEEQQHLGSWFCNLIMVQRRKCLIFCHSTTLYCFVVPTVTKKDFLGFIDVFQQNLTLNLRYEGIEPSSISKLVENYQKVIFSRTTSRSILGSMNDYSRMFKYYAESEGVVNCNIFAINKKMNSSPMSALKYSNGSREMKQLLIV